MAGLQNPAMLALILAATPVAYMVLKADETEKKVVGAAKIAAIVLLAVAAASPYIVTTESLSEQPTATVLVDDSASTQLMDNYSLNLEGVETVRKVIATGNESDLRQGIQRNIEENTPYLIISDGQSSENIESLASKFYDKNSTLHMLKPGMTQDASVTVKGPESTVLGAENSFTVEVDSTNNTATPVPEVQVDGGEVELQREEAGVYSFTRSFSSEQDHTIRASIGLNDRFKSNNQYFKTVEVTEKPEILVVGNPGELSDELEEFYDLTYEGSIPEELSSYYTVIAKKPFQEEELASYITQGNGLIYTGSYENENSLLPVRKADAGTQGDSTELILALDNSGQLGGEGDRRMAHQVSKSIIADMGGNNRIGIIGYNGKEIIQLDPKKVSGNRRKLVGFIDQLTPQNIAPHEDALNVSSSAAKEKGNILLITDGEYSKVFAESCRTAERRRETLNTAERIPQKLIIIDVSTGEETCGGEEFLKEVKRRNGGEYYHIQDIIDSSGKINPSLAGLDEGGGESSVERTLKITRSDHFITRGLALNSVVTNIRGVETKANGEQLVKTSSGIPALSTWRYGLGRVAAFSAGNKDLGRISINDPELVSRTVSWTVGQPQRKEEEVLTVSDARQGETVEAEATYKVEGLKRQGENLYTAELSPGGTGFHSFKEDVYGYSYSEELEDIGYSEELENLVASTGGKTFAPSEKQEIKSELEKFSNREIQTEKPLSNYFIFAALIVFLSEVGYRKLNGRK